MRMRRFVILSSRIVEGNVLQLVMVAKFHHDRFAFQAGQYVSLGFISQGRPSPMRCFSMTNSPSNPYKLEFSIKVEGSFTHALADLPVGSTVFVQGPYGGFTLQRTITEPIILLAGGIGITPLMSMLRSAAEQGVLNRIILLYSVPTEEHILFSDELLELQRNLTHFNCAFFITNDRNISTTSGRHMVHGRITSHALWALTDGYPNNYTYFISGSTSFVAGMKDALSQNDTQESRIITEEFSSSNKFIPRDRPTRLTYVVAATALLLSISLITFIDVSQYSQKYAKALAASKRTAISSHATSSKTKLASPVPVTTEPLPTPMQTTPVSAPASAPAVPNTAPAVTTPTVVQSSSQPVSTTSAPSTTVTPTPAPTPQPKAQYVPPTTSIS